MKQPQIEAFFSWPFLFSTGIFVCLQSKVRLEKALAACKSRLDRILLLLTILLQTLAIKPPTTPILWHHRSITNVIEAQCWYSILFGLCQPLKVAATKVRLETRLLQKQLLSIVANAAAATICEHSSSSKCISGQMELVQSLYLKPETKLNERNEGSQLMLYCTWIKLLD